MGCGLSLAGLMVMLMPVLGVLVVLGVDRRRGAFLVFSSRSSPLLFPTLLSLHLSPTFPSPSLPPSSYSPPQSIVLFPPLSGERLPPPFRSLPMTMVVVLVSCWWFDG